MKNNKKIINLIYKIIMDNLNIDEFISLSKSEKNLFINIIFKSRAHFLVYKLFKKNEEDYKNYDFYKKAKETVNLYSLQSMVNLEESYKLNKILNDYKIKFVFLKGFHLLNSYYNDLIERPIRDIDILVKREDIKKIVNILTKRGYSFEYNVDDASLDYFLKKSYDIPVLIGKNGSRLEVHFSIEPSSSAAKCVFSKKFLNDSKKIEFGNTYANVLSEEDLILHLIYHGIKKSGPNVGIIFITDVYKVLILGNYDISTLIKKSQFYNLTPHLKIVIEILCMKSNSIKLHKLNDKLIYAVDSKTIEILDMLLINNAVTKEEVRLFQLVRKMKLRKLFQRFHRSSLQREYKIHKNQNAKLFFAHILRVTRHIKIILYFVIRVIFFKSFRLQFYKIKNILNYINDY